jgi:hypothetical protein
MKIISRIFLALFFLINDLFAQPGPPGGTGGPPCWPPSTCETPINNELYILLAVGVVYMIYLKKKKPEIG